MSFYISALALQRAVTVAVFVLLMTGCSSQHARPETHESLNAGLWTQTAAEYAANTLQAYHIARDSLDRALADPQWTAALEQQGDYTGLPPAVLLDIDQTVLDNSRYNARLILEDEDHTREKFTAWCQEAAAPVIPGAGDFIRYAVAQNVAVIYYSARPESLRDCTGKNLQAYGLPLPDQQHLLLNDGTASSSKAQQRTGLISRYRILLLVGDNLDDFVTGSKADPATRRATAKRYAGRWGREWIILPNPIYGHWETSIYGFDYTLPRKERLRRKLQMLQQ